jgi:DNA-binding GntR family transcriptional regulator
MGERGEVAVAAQNLSQAICSKLGERILHWQYLPGHRLTEEGLCAEFKVSRSPIREALNMLVENGLVDKTPRQGYRVRLLDFDEIKELYEVRLALEEHVIVHICRVGMDEKRIRELEAFWSKIQKGLPLASKDVPAADESFHETLAQLTRNRALVRYLKDIDRRIHFVRLADITSLQRVKATCEEHIELLRAIRARDEKRALDALRRNIEGGRSSVELAIKEALAHAYQNRT